MPKAALFLDRDGLINRMVNYDGKWDSPQKQKDVVLTNGIVKIIKWANQRHIPVIEITNQPGVAKGTQTQSQADDIEAQVHKLLVKKSVKVNKVYTCRHHPKGVIPELTGECECRKPKPGLLLQAAKELNIDLTKSIFLGDKASDILAGQAVNCKTIIYLHNKDQPEKVEAAKNSNADYKVSSLFEVLSILPTFLDTEQ